MIDKENIILVDKDNICGHKAKWVESNLKNLRSFERQHISEIEALRKRDGWNTGMFETI